MRLEESSMSNGMGAGRDNGLMMGVHQFLWSRELSRGCNDGASC
jgi:hypothetical protein